MPGTKHKPEAGNGMAQVLAVPVWEVVVVGQPARVLQRSPSEGLLGSAVLAISRGTPQSPALVLWSESY